MLKLVQINLNCIWIN